MATTALISVGEYLATSYHPDREYIDGSVLERNLGQLNHSWMQGELLVSLRPYRASLGLFAFPEQRVQVKSTRYRVPDVILTHGLPNEQIITSPPFLCIEILSPEDSMSAMQEKIDDYLAFGVENIWIIDARRKKASWVDANGIHEAKDSILQTIGAPIQLDLSTIWPA